MNKLIVAFRNFANAPKILHSLHICLFSTDVKTNSNFFPYTALIGCLLRGTGWIFNCLSCIQRGSLESRRCLAFL